MVETAFLQSTSVWSCTSIMKGKRSLTAQICKWSYLYGQSWGAVFDVAGFSNNDFGTALSYMLPPAYHPCDYQ